MSTSSPATSQTNIFDPLDVLANPTTIAPRIRTKCQQFLVSDSPIITRTCWNRRFGGDINLCKQTTQLLVAAGLLLEGEFAANSTKAYGAWIKQLPDDPTNTATTLNFQQTKLNIFGITWNQYISSFKRIEFGHNNSSTLVSKAGATILRTKPYTDIGFILDESIVLEKEEKSNSYTMFKEKSIILRKFFFRFKYDSSSRSNR
jgi:hypothetical protein